jgi:hypothetical protein
VIREGETAERSPPENARPPKRNLGENTAKEAFVAAQSADNEAAKAERPDWEPVKRLYDRVAADCPGTTSADLAADRAGALAELINAAREREQAAGRSAESRAAAFRDALVKAVEKADALAAAFRFGEATAAFNPVRPAASNAGESTEVDTAVEKILKTAEGVAEGSAREGARLRSGGSLRQGERGARRALRAFRRRSTARGGPSPRTLGEIHVRRIGRDPPRVVEKREADAGADVVATFDARRESADSSQRSIRTVPMRC